MSFSHIYCKATPRNLSFLFKKKISKLYGGDLGHFFSRRVRVGQMWPKSPYSRVSNCRAGMEKNRVSAAKIGNPALQIGKEKAPTRPGFLLILSPIDIRSGK